MNKRKALILLISAAALLITAGLILVLSKPSAKIVSIAVEPLESNLIDTAWYVWQEADGNYEQKLWKGIKPTGSDYVKVTFRVRFTNLSPMHWYASKALVGSYDSADNFFIAEWSEPTPYKMGRLSRSECEFTVFAYRGGRTDDEIKDIIRSITLDMELSKRETKSRVTLSAKDAEIIINT